MLARTVAHSGVTAIFEGRVPAGGTTAEVLLTPGPVTPYPEVAGALAAQPLLHYGPAWVKLHERVRGRAAQVFRTAEDPWLVFAPGMATIEMGLRTCLSPGDPVLVCINGVFGERMATVATACGLAVTAVEAPLGSPIDPASVREVASRLPGLRAACVVHHETGIGLVNPVREIGEALDGTDSLLIVDAISSLGGIALDVDRWHIDLCTSVANKCLGAPVGVALLTASSRAWAAADDGRDRSPGWYLDLRTWRAAKEARPLHPTPVTMPTAAVAALDLALERLIAEGLEARFAKLSAVAQRVRDAFRALGFEPVVPDEWASPVTTAIYIPAGFDAVAYASWLHERHGLVVAGGIGALTDRIIRVGHMARASDPEVIDRFLEATTAYIRSGKRYRPR